MPNVIDRQAAEALIQEQLIATISQDAPKQSVFMQLAKKLPNMTSKQTRIPVLDMLPMAYWVNGDTGFKQTSQQAWDNVYLTAEELAVIVPIPEAVVNDASFDIMGEVQPRVFEAIGQCVDSAAIFGVNRPAAWPADIITRARQAGNNVAPGSNPNYYDLINTGMYDVDKVDCTWQLVMYSQWYGVYGNYINEETNTTRLIGQDIDNDQMWFNHNSKAGQAIGVPVVARNKNRTIATNFGIDINGTFYPYDRPQGNENTSNIVLFGQRSWQASKIKIYSLAMYKDDILVRNYIPCIDPSGAIGMYDAVGKQFYGNSGTGAFVAGPAV